MPLTGDVQSSLHSLITSLLTYQTTGGGHSPKRYYSLLFRDLPNKKQYADYYSVIREPRSLNGVMESLRKGSYSSPTAVAYDLFLIWANAKEYNEQGSQVYKDSLKLETYMEKLWNDRQRVLPPYSSLHRPMSKPVENRPEVLDGGHTAKKIKLTSSSLTSSKEPIRDPALQQLSSAPTTHRIRIGGGSTSSTPSATSANTATPRIRLVNAPSNPPITLKLGGSNKTPAIASSAAETLFSKEIIQSVPELPEPTSPPATLSADSHRPTRPAVTSSVSSRSQEQVSSNLQSTAEQIAKGGATSSRPAGPDVLPGSISTNRSVANEHLSTPVVSTQFTPPVANMTTPGNIGDPFLIGASDLSPPHPQPMGNGIFQTLHGTLLGPNGLPLKKETRKDRRAREKTEKLRLRAEAEAAAAAGTPRPDLVKTESHTNTGPKFDGIPDVDPGWMGGEIPNDPVPIYVDIIQKLRDHTDATGRQLATPFLTLPDRAARPDYYAVVAIPISLEVIEERASGGSYETPEQFDRDLHQLFQNARIFIKHDTPGNAYSDLVVLQRLYQELTKRRSHMTPPKSLALSSLSSVAAGPGNISQLRRADSPTGGEDGDNMKSVSNSRITLKDKIFLDGINFKGDILRVGDWVHLLNPDNPGKPIIAQIFKVYKRIDSPQRCISVCWYYRPEETVHPASRQFYENEVFKTSNFVDHAVEDYIDRCFVMFFTRYIRGRPRPPAFRPPMILYVCEHRYKDDVKSFKKIKNWNSCVPEEIRKNEYDFVPYHNDRIDALPRIKSPFVRGLGGPGGIGDALEKEEEDQAKYHFLPGGEPATAHRIRTTKEQSDLAPESPPPEDVAPPAMALYGNGVPLSTPPVVHPPVLVRPDKQPPPTALPQIGAGMTPTEMAVAHEKFAPLPNRIHSKFQCARSEDLVWFAAPATSIPQDNLPTHSLEYLYCIAQKKSRIAEDVHINGRDV